MPNPKLGFLIFTFLVTNLCLARSRTDLFIEKQRLSRVLHLPGQNFDVGFKHYSGYVTVNEEYGRELFYWFVEAVEDPLSKPVVLWLNGGPGCSSIAFGMSEEIGPFHVDKDGKSLYLNPYSWNQAANILFLDTPVGVGFSYANTSSDLLTNGDKRTASDSLIFLSKFFDQFPQFRNNEFYITGESYAGHYVPQLSQAIVRYNSGRSKKAINLKGYMVGNALTDDYNDHLGIFQFMWAAGMISDQTYNQLNQNCHFQPFIHSPEKCDEIMYIAYEEIGNIDPYSIFTPPCTANFGLSGRFLKKWRMVGHVGQTYDPCSEKHSIAYFNLPEVQKALHVDPSKAPSKWDTCSNTVNLHWQDSPITVLDVYRELIGSIRVWVFSGDTDAVIPVTSTRYSINALNLTTVSPWRAWYDDGQGLPYPKCHYQLLYHHHHHHPSLLSQQIGVGGWTQEYKGLTFVSVRGAGHEVPLHRPKQAFTLFKSFLSGNSMPAFEGVRDI